MKKSVNKSIVVAVILLMMYFTGSSLKNQGEKYSAETTSIVIAGTSTLHDWEMKSAKGSCNVQFSYSNGNIADITQLSFTTPAEALKSGKGAMDNNAYKALKTDKHKEISFFMTSGSVSATDANTYLIKTRGKLTIAGTSKDVELSTTAKTNVDKSLITCSGNYKIDMKEYNVTPPSFMMGAVKTGKDITIRYTLQLKH